MKGGDKITRQITLREAAFLALCRRIGEGYIENVSISEGQPAVLKGIVQRVDLKKPAELEAALRGETIVLNDTLKGNPETIP